MFLLFAAVGCGPRLYDRIGQIKPQTIHVPTSSVIVGCGITTPCYVPPRHGSLYWHETERVVNVSSFRLDEHEVTTAEYRLCVAAHGCDGVLHTNNEASSALVAFAKAFAYCHWRGGRLPLSVEWEAAARGREGRIYPWGSTPIPTIDELGLSDERASPGSDVSYLMYVPTKLPAGPYGHRDMVGAAPEFVQDTISPNRHLIKGAFTASSELNPIEATNTTYGELVPDGFRAGIRCAYSDAPH